LSSWIEEAAYHAEMAHVEVAVAVTRHARGNIRWNARRQVSGSRAASALCARRPQNLRPLDEPLQISLVALFPAVGWWAQAAFAETVHRFEDYPTASITPREKVLRLRHGLDRFRGDLPGPPFAPVAIPELTHGRSLLRALD
jgi:hypothetical protein